MVDLILLILICLLVIGFFSGIEIAFISANKITLEVKKAQGDRRAAMLSPYMNAPDLFLTASIIAFNIFLAIFSYLFSELFFHIYPYNKGTHSSPPFSYLLLETATLTIFVFFVGEVIPKIVFRKRSLFFILFFAPIIVLTVKLIHPVSKILIHISRFLLKRIFKVKNTSMERRGFTYLDLEEYVQLTTTEEENKDRIIDRDFVSNIMEFSNVQVRACLIHRNDIEAVSIDDTFDTVKQKFIESKLSRLVVYKENLDNLVGYIHQLDIVRGTQQIADMLIPLPTIPETMKAQDLLKHLSEQRKSMAWVVDEYGLTAGIVTTENLLREIFGELKDEFDTDEIIEQKISDKLYRFSGKISLLTLKEKYDIQLPDDDVSTLSGLLIKTNKTIPQKGQTMKIKKYIFTILATSATKIELAEVLITK